MLDANEAGIGHNNPPPYDPELFSGLTNDVAAFMDATKVWLYLAEVYDESQAEQLTDQISGLRGLYKKADDARKAAKKPHDDAGKAVQAAFKPLLEKLELAANELKGKLAAYATKKAERERVERERVEALARKQAEEAEAKLKAAQEANDIAAQVEAQQAAEDAEKQAAAAAKPKNTQVKSASGAGKTMAVRTIKEVTVTNPRVLFMRYQDHSEVIDLLKRIATQEVRAKGYDADADPIAGIEISERKTVA